MHLLLVCKGQFDLDKKKVAFAQAIENDEEVWELLQMQVPLHQHLLTELDQMVFFCVLKKIQMNCTVS